jgi:hypothetical protein
MDGSLEDAPTPTANRAMVWVERLMIVESAERAAVELRERSNSATDIHNRGGHRSGHRTGYPVVSQSASMQMWGRSAPHQTHASDLPHTDHPTNDVEVSSRFTECGERVLR